MEDGGKVVVAGTDVPKDGRLRGVRDTVIVRSWIDVTDESAVVGFFERVHEVYGRIDILVNSASVALLKPVSLLTKAEWDLVLATNLTGVFLCCREAVKVMHCNGGGELLLSGRSRVNGALRGHGAYGSSKAGVSMLSSVLNEELKHENIRSTVIRYEEIPT